MNITQEAFFNHLVKLSEQNSVVNVNPAYWIENVGLPKAAECIALRLFMLGKKDAKVSTYLRALHDDGCATFLPPKS